MKLFVKLVMSLVGAAGGLVFGITILQVALQDYSFTETRVLTAGLAVVATVVGWFIGLYAGRLICHEPPAK